MHVFSRLTARAATVRLAPVLVSSVIAVVPARTWDACGADRWLVARFVHS